LFSSGLQRPRRPEAPLFTFQKTTKLLPFRDHAFGDCGNGRDEGEFIRQAVDHPGFRSAQGGGNPLNRHHPGRRGGGEKPIRVKAKETQSKVFMFKKNAKNTMIN
jgi:hypothetical protein